MEGLVVRGERCDGAAEDPGCAKLTIDPMGANSITFLPAA